MDDDPPLGASVFTTLRWDGSRVAWLDRHILRLRRHAECLEIEWPTDFDQRLASTTLDGDGNLCQISLNRDGEIRLTLRRTEYPHSPLTAISQVAPRFNQRVQGTKHDDWSAYQIARKNAKDSGADIALLVHNGIIVDGDRCTPILLDIDGIAYAPEPDGGGVDSVTLEVLSPAIEASGIPFRRARLTEKLLGRAREIIVVGTGVGVAWLNQIDGQPIGTNSSGPLYTTCALAFESKLRDSWTDLEARN
ncbi:MAG: aminotransferase class IV [Candidatus Thalassarchaeaceae archaeon]|nr:aminotransferase class IV [Candidatus Thalassarchaeaceae archaeon]